MTLSFIWTVQLSKRKCLKYDERCERGAIPERFHDMREVRAKLCGALRDEKVRWLSPWSPALERSGARIPEPYWTRTGNPATKWPRRPTQAHVVAFSRRASSFGSTSWVASVSPLTKALGATAGNTANPQATMKSVALVIAHTADPATVAFSFAYDF
ncbi:hypothetical protein GW17_00001704 [Ensete ventricosum]|nr:hypothetical protein GW17_00001704 [Ensete ventricosum]